MKTLWLVLDEILGTAAVAAVVLSMIYFELPS